MDPQRFDSLTTSVSRPGTRRGLVRLVAALPFAGFLLERLADDASAAGRRKRRTKRHKHHSGDNKDHRNGKRKGKHKGKGKDTIPQPGCVPTTCAAQGKNCGTIADGCGTQTRCGPDSCGAGYTCTDNQCRCRGWDRRLSGGLLRGGTGLSAWGWRMLPGAGPGCRLRGTRVWAGHGQLHGRGLRLWTGG